MASQNIPRHFENMHNNPPAPFNVDVIINKEVFQKVTEEMERLEETKPCKDRAERAIRYKKVYNNIVGTKGIRYKDATESQLKRYGYFNRIPKF